MSSFTSRTNVTVIKTSHHNTHQALSRVLRSFRYGDYAWNDE